MYELFMTQIKHKIRYSYFCFLLHLYFLVKKQNVLGVDWTVLQNAILGQALWSSYAAYIQFFYSLHQQLAGVVLRIKSKSSTMLQHTLHDLSASFLNLMSHLQSQNGLYLAIQTCFLFSLLLLLCPSSILSIAGLLIHPKMILCDYKVPFSHCIPLPFT